MPRIILPPPYRARSQRVPLAYRPVDLVEMKQLTISRGALAPVLRRREPRLAPCG